IDGWHVAVATCPEVATRPLEPLGEIVQQVLDHEPHTEDAFDADLLADLAALWRNVAVPVVGDLGEAVVEALVDHAGRHPTVVAVDDAHHLTPTTLELLRRLSSTAAPLVVVLAQVASTGRPDPGGGVGLTL